MKKIFLSIIGVIAFISIPAISLAGYCDLATWNTYQSVYCDLAWDGNQKPDEEIMDAIAIQLGFDEINNGGELVRIIVSGELDLADVIPETTEEETCNRIGINKFMNDNNVKLDELPIDIKNACSATDSRSEASEWGRVINSVRSAYDKERVLYHTKKSMEYEFQSSEKYWDNSLMNSPFDLMLDLNLIEIVLFGSQAQWMNDVFMFPVEEDEGGGGEGEGEGEEPDVETQDLASPGGDEAETEGVTATTTETEGSEPDCVPADDPDADLGDTPGNEANPECGNGELDVLLGEQCDDGNNVSGDGCSQYCMKEATGADDVCMDPDAVTFQSPSNSQSGSQSDNQSDNQSDDQSNGCPPGTFPTQDTSITGPGLDEQPEYPQSNDYPGPHTGGTFKDYPPSTAPACPPGYSEVVIQYGNKEERNCVPTEFCASFDDIREHLFGEDWQEDEAKSSVATAIEALFCVTVTTANRPTTPYAMNDGCIDCHVIGMVDALDKALETNVSPLENTTGSFGISSRWGPKFSFNLVTALKSKFKVVLPPDNQKTAMQKADEARAASLAENGMVEPTISTGESGVEELARKQEQEQTSSATVLNDLKNYRVSNVAISDQSFSSRVLPLFQQMLKSFERIESKLMGIAEIAINQKDTCQF
ncbi:hypothetical protein KKA95_03100 [Patescibacteria group bacterium]|nr:hypothetical protein [Patescibacteria group bacterium]